IEVVKAYLIFISTLRIGIELIKVISAKGGASKSDGPDTNNYRSNGDVGGFGHLRLPHSWNTDGHPNSCMTLLLEEPHWKSHLKKERKVNTNRHGEGRIESYFLSCRFELINGDIRHGIYHPEHHEHELGIGERGHRGGEGDLDLDFQ
ncbi:hypothetical protein HAX54_011942, partial [Datura stramonium]|nr:hypothetical protein [Datura stramonium]